MRVGSIVLLKEQGCVQSYGWKMIRPLGSLQEIVDSLTEYQCDEISIIRPVRKNDNLKSFGKDIEVIKELKTMTPISFGGGIRSLDHLKLLKNLPVERLIFSSAFLENNRDLILCAKNIFGNQAIKCLLPVFSENGQILVYHPSAGAFFPISSDHVAFIEELANEVILFDTKNEGYKNKFDWSILKNLPFDSSKIIISGGAGGAMYK